MCDPVTLSVVSMAISATGAVAAGKAQYDQAKYEQGVANTNAVYATRAAQDAQKRGDTELMQHYRQVASLKAAQVAAFGAQGIDASSGSALDIQTDTAIQGNEDAYNINQNTANETQGFAIQRSNMIAEGKAAGSRATGAIIGTALNVGSSIVGGASQVYGAQAKYGTPSWMKGWGKSGASAPTYKGF